MSKILIYIGIFFIVGGLVVFLFEKVGIHLGRLPGDIFIKKENSSFYFPITTCIVVSILLSLLFTIFRK